MPLENHFIEPMSYPFEERTERRLKLSDLPQEKKLNRNQRRLQQRLEEKKLRQKNNPNHQ